MGNRLTGRVHTEDAARLLGMVVPRLVKRVGSVHEFSLPGAVPRPRPPDGLANGW